MQPKRLIPILYPSYTEHFVVFSFSPNFHPSHSHNRQESELEVVKVLGTSHSGGLACETHV